MNSGEKIPFGACVWSTGNTALDFVRELGLTLSKDGRIKIDEKLRVETADGKYNALSKMYRYFILGVELVCCNNQSKKGS